MVDESIEDKLLQNLDKKESSNEAPLGKIDNITNEIPEMNIGYLDYDPSNLYTKGMYNEADLRIEFRAATLEEVKHFSTINEEDPMDASEKVRQILNKCYNVYENGKKISVDTLKEPDKIFLLFNLRDVTMAKHQRANKLLQSVVCNKCGHENQKEIDHNAFSFYEIEDKFMKYYDENERCFIVPIPESGKSVKAYMPSIGVVYKTQKFIYDSELKKQKGQNVFYDPNFLIFYQFMTKNHHNITDKNIEVEYGRFKSWDYDFHMVFDKLTHGINLGVKPTLSFPCENTNCKELIQTPLRFQGGIRSIFNLKSAADRLF